MDLVITGKPVQRIKPLKNRTFPYLNEIPQHFIHGIKRKGCDIISN